LAKLGNTQGHEILLNTFENPQSLNWHRLNATIGLSYLGDEHARVLMAETLTDLGEKYKHSEIHAPLLALIAKNSD
jgi:hypothetical protein